MRSQWLGLSIVVVFAIGLGWWLLKPTDYVPTNYPPQGTTVVAFGDSLVAGIGAQTPGGFVTMLSERLEVPIINEGEPGDTSADALARLSDVTQHEPDIVLLLVGGNDALRRLPADETFANLREIIESLQNEGVLVVVLGVRGGIFSREYDKRFPALARETRAVFEPDVLEGLFGQSELMSDTVHPNEAGYQLIADRLEPVLTELLSAASV